MKRLKLTKKKTEKLMVFAGIWGGDATKRGVNYDGTWVLMPNLAGNNQFADHVAMKCLQRLKGSVSPALTWPMKDIDEGDSSDWVCTSSVFAGANKGDGGNTPTEAIFRAALRQIKCWERTDKQLGKKK